MLSKSNSETEIRLSVKDPFILLSLIVHQVLQPPGLLTTKNSILTSYNISVYIGIIFDTT